ncbi:DUF502 domain-containing protein [Limihaloglobus sulfuriphilus]|nr:DUF502 domain-containing protein [Limihaloglobus sulfuriphilus]
MQLYHFLSHNVSRHVNVYIVKLISAFTDNYTVAQLEAFWVSGGGQVAGFIVPLIAICIIGAMLASVIGRSFLHAFDDFLKKLPLFKDIYPYLKQITDFFFSHDKIQFKRVVAIEYPRKGIWSLGLVTGEGLTRFPEIVGESGRMLTIFIPSSPTPFTGYVVMIKESDAVNMSLTIEEALRFTISGGVVTPTQWNQHVQKSSEHA